MRNDPETIVALVQGQFGEDHKVLLVRQADGHYEEAQEALDTKPQQDPDAITATVEGRFGEEHKIILVRQSDGRYIEAADPSEPVSL